MPRTGEALGQRTSNCRDRYFAVRLYIELKTVPPTEKGGGDGDDGDAGGAREGGSR